jgi:outer membrane receptor protein involved in Fe transport
MIKLWFVKIPGLVVLMILTIMSNGVYAEGRHCIVEGQVADDKGEAVPFANVSIENTAIGTLTDEQGKFILTTKKTGKHNLVFSFMGYETQKVNVHLVKGETIHLNIILKTSVTQLGEVVITTKSVEQVQREEPIRIEVLKIKELQTQSVNLPHALKQTTGVVVRQQGGLGSFTSISLNGLTGNAVRIYYDGIPLDVYGGGIQVNNIPVDALEKVEIYKGIMPIEIGTDALGGGVNLVSSRTINNSLRSSYSVGSFNTHRFNLSGNIKVSDKFSISGMGFYNYSDNDYVMKNITNQIGPYEIDTIDARRFHSAHSSGFINIDASLRDIVVADLLRISGSYSQRQDELQHGRRIQSTAFGEAHGSLNTTSVRLDYRKAIFKSKALLRYYGIYSYTQDYADDSTTNVYNWRGQIISDQNDKGAEVSSNPTLREGVTEGTVHRIAASYKLLDELKLTVSDYFRYSEISGEDPVGNRITVGGEKIDPNTVPSTLSRNILGVELKSMLFSEKLTAVLFYKHYSYSSKAINIYATNVSTLLVKEVKDDNHGYGFGLKYVVSPSIFVRGSYERATRLPREREIFGNFTTIVPNYSIRPESSDNWNLGMNFTRSFSNSKFVSLQLEGFIRNRENLIRPDEFSSEQLIFVNEASVDGWGGEFSARVMPVQDLNFVVNVTRQKNTITTPSLGVGARSRKLIVLN